MKYFMSFEFNRDGRFYYFPLLLNTENIGLAKQQQKSVVKALEEHFETVNYSNPVLFVDGFNDEMINHYNEHQMRGKLVRLELRNWTFEGVKTVEDFTFSEQVNYCFEPYRDNPSIPTRVFAQSYQFPVRLIDNSDDLLNQDVIIIDVINQLPMSGN
ncbi:MAG: hypothetical protein H8D23_31545 [Candidatus Brocadiales bacterium]|nr:hypothetical protein [Candidatus Brocadiales bacterium]